MTNEEMKERYPFLEFDEEGYSFLDDMPIGWKAAFGEQLCEELRQLLLRANFLDKYKVCQVKEKFGELRWYDDSGVPGKFLSEYYDLLDKYRDISRRTCVRCGQPAQYMTTGWIIPICKKCADEINLSEEGLRPIE